jgi:hypothetical protein
MPTAQATDVSVNDDELAVDLLDGRTIIVPIVWFPRLVHGTAKERKNWRLIGQGEGIHWPDLDEDISVYNLLADNHRERANARFKAGWRPGRGARLENRRENNHGQNPSHRQAPQGDPKYPQDHPDDGADRHCAVQKSP